MRTITLALVAVAGLGAACERAPLTVPEPDVDGGLPPAPDLAPPPGGGDCIGLSECDCWRRPECAVIADSCWCPFPQCDDGGACGCGGGAFLGCAPVSSGCAGSVPCGPAGRRVGPGELGCFECRQAGDCPAAWSQLLDGLEALGCRPGDALVGGFSCDVNPDCVQRCIAEVSGCGQIGCGLCTVCGCAGAGPFEQCFYDCRRR